MKSNLIKKMIVSSVVFSLTFCMGMELSKQKNIAHAYDFDDYDDVEIFKGELSIAGYTTHFGIPAVKVNIPKGVRIKDIDIDNEPHDNIDEAIVNGQVVIYGLRNGVTYRNLVLTIEDFTGVEYKYILKPFTINGNNVNAPNNQVPVTPQYPNANIPNIPPSNSQNDFIYDDMEIFKGELSIAGYTTHFGSPAVKVNIPKGIRVKDIDIDNEPHDHIDEAIVNGQIVIYGLRNGVTYRNLLLTIEDFTGVEYKYILNPFTINGNNVNIPNNQAPVTPQYPNVNTAELPIYIKNIYKNVFNREVDNDGMNYWNNKLSSRQVELEDFFKNLLVEREFAEVAPQVEDKITKLYTGIFQRQPDEGGFKFWVEKYKQELRKEGNEKEALKEIIDEMTDGQEFRELLVKLGLNNF